jgi:hypothetical protein
VHILLSTLLRRLRALTWPVLAGFALAATCVPSLHAAEAAAAAPLVLEAKIGLGEVRGRLDHLAADVDRQRVFVAELGNDSVGVVDAATGKLLQTLRGLREPQGIGYVSAEDTLYVANAGDGSVRAFRGAAYEPGARVDLGDDADDVHIDPRTGEVVVGYGSGGLASIDPARSRMRGKVPLSAHPEGFQLDPASARAFVNLPGAHQIAVVDRQQGKVLGALPVNGGRSNFPMDLDDSGEKLFVVFRSPPRLAVYSTKTQEETARIDTCGDSDDVFYDDKRARVYVSCGEGFIDVLQWDNGHLRRLDRLPTVSGARTSLFVAEWDRLYLAVRATVSEPAALWVFRPVP